MGWRVTWRVTCDGCGRVGPGVWRGKVPGYDAEKAAVHIGWRAEKQDFYGNMAHLCPVCAKRPPDWWVEPEEA